MAKEYFVRNAHGQKGPYTLKQMKAALDERSFSADAEYRTGDAEAWQPIAALAERLARSEAKKRGEQVERAPEIVAPGEASGQPKSSTKEAIGFFVLLALAGAALWFTRVDRDAEMGKPCRTRADCQGRATCMLVIDDDRNIAPEGYCTFTCSDSSSCKPGFHCGQVVETGPQGAKWDGTFGKNAKACLKR